MPASAVTVANLALSHLGDLTVTSLDSSLEASSRLVELVNVFLPQARQELLESARWTFARSRAALSAVAGSPAFEWEHWHALPTDVVRVLEFKCGSSYDSKLEDFCLEGGLVLSNQEYVALRYIRDAQSYSEWNPTALGALARLLASYLAGPVKGDASAADYHRKVYETIDLPQAQYRNLVQDRSNENRALEAEMARSTHRQRRFRGVSSG